jgi:hypothetical protein
VSEKNKGCLKKTKIQTKTGNNVFFKIKSSSLREKQNFLFAKKVFFSKKKTSKLSVKKHGHF